MPGHSTWDARKSTTTSVVHVLPLPKQVNLTVGPTKARRSEAAPTRWRQFPILNLESTGGSKPLIGTAGSPSEKKSSAGAVPTGAIACSVVRGVLPRVLCGVGVGEETVRVTAALELVLFADI